MAITTLMYPGQAIKSHLRLQSASPSPPQPGGQASKLSPSGHYLGLHSSHLISTSYAGSLPQAPLFRRAWALVHYLHLSV